MNGDAVFDAMLSQGVLILQYLAREYQTQLVVGFRKRFAHFVLELCRFDTLINRIEVWNKMQN